MSHSLNDTLPLQDTTDLESLTETGNHLILVELVLEHMILPVIPCLNH